MVARRHFECHVRGTPRPPPPYSSAATIPHVAPIHIAKKTPILVPAIVPPLKPRTYASAAISASRSKQFRQPQKQFVQTHPKPARVDYLLLVRVSIDHPSLKMSPYAVMLHLNSFLKEKLVLEIQTTNTGFAICPTSTAAQEIFSARMSEIQAFLSTRGQFEITATVVAEALTDLIKVAPISVLEPRNTSKAEYAAHKDWVVFFPAESTSLSRNLPLFGIRVQSKLLPKKTKLPQCKIRKSAAAAKLRLRATHCAILGAKNPAATETTASVVPSTPPAVRSLFTEPSSSPLTRDRFAVLSNQLREIRAWTEQTGQTQRIVSAVPRLTNPRAPSRLRVLRPFRDLGALARLTRRSCSLHATPIVLGQPWWDQSCREAKQRYSETVRSLTPSYDATKEFRKVIRRAKTSFFQKKLNDVSNAKEVWDITKWHKSKGTFRAPPLSDPRSPNTALAHNLEDKREVLFRNLLQNHSDTEDVSLSTPTVPTMSLPFPDLTIEEVSRSILGAGNTTPGNDQIPTAVLRLSWPQISDIVLNLFQECINIGHHPQCFHTAIIAIIGKPKKADMTNPRAYRLISLLSVLGKRHERIVAKRMSWTAINFKVLASQQFGALPLRSSVDLTTCLTHVVEAALFKGLTASVATLDIKGAFETVLPIQAAKALKVAHALCCLGNTIRGVPPYLSRQAVLACVLPIAHFGSETWWPGASKKIGSKTISNRVGKHLEILDKTHRAAARAILPAFRTVPLPTLLREAGILSAETALDGLSRRAAIRIRKLDPRHLLSRRGSRSLLTPAVTRFSRSYRLIPASENFNPLLLPSWDTPEIEIHPLNRISGTTGTPNLRAGKFREFLLTVPPSNILVYSDAAKLPDGNTGGGFAIFQLGRKIRTEDFPLGNGKEIYDAEACAALEGIRAATALPSACFSNNLWIFIDNLKVAKRFLTKANSTSSQETFIDALEVAKAWKARTRLPHIRGGEIRVRWVPIHSGIEGNEIADSEAKKRCRHILPGWSI
ncbi:hypothetical protein K3495_g3606 [Podosphaera aphanis]|nr:hypothetical protein K3495_g3606 [Podosphaera aphanis]